MAIVARGSEVTPANVYLGPDEGHPGSGRTAVGGGAYARRRGRSPGARVGALAVPVGRRPRRAAPAHRRLLRPGRARRAAEPVLPRRGQRGAPDHVTTWWAEVFGGPADYTERHGGYAAMLAHHLRLGITPDQRLRFATLMSLAADDAELPADPEFRAALVGYLEWGTRLAMHNSHPGADVVQEAPVPRWGWGVAPPYQPGA